MSRFTSVFSVLLRLTGVMVTIALLMFSGAHLAVAVAQGSGHGQHGSGITTAATAEQQRAAAELVASVKAGIARYAQVTAGEADGYRQNKPFRFGTWGPAHYSNRTNGLDGRMLDPQRPEGLVYLKLGTGETVLLGAVFRAPKGQGPRPGGPLTEWHSHECVTGMGNAARSVNGQCPPGTTLVPAAGEMLHVWTFDNPDGAFAHGLTMEAIKAVVSQFSRR